MTSLRYAARSDVGLLRDGNEDSVYAGPRQLAVADGMGGAAAGEVASSVAISALAPLDADAPGPDLLEALSTAAYDANDHLREMIAADASLSGMGTTLTAMLVAGTRIGLLHIGDSRAYLLRGGELTQITHDHTLVQSFVDQGRITREQANSHPQRALILRALQGDDHLELDLSVRDTKPGDRYLLCSDGLSGVVSDETLCAALQLADPQESVDRMVELALRGGGPDNITCIVAEVTDESQDTGSDGVVVAGAASEYTAVVSPRADTPAVRAARMSAPVKAARPVVVSYAAANATKRKRPPVRPFVVLGAVAAIVALVVLGGLAYVHRQYYVGVHDSQVTVFRGVPESVVGVDLSSVKDATGIPVAGLLPFWRDKVEANITANSLRAARAIVTELRANQLPPCPAGTPGAAAAVTAAAPAASASSAGPRPAGACTAAAK